MNSIINSVKMGHFFAILKEGMNMLGIPRVDELFDLSHTVAAELLLRVRLPHEAIGEIREYILEYVSRLSGDYREISDGVYVANDAKIWAGATVCGPTLIGHRTEVRPGAFIRGDVIIGDDAVIGNSTEVKNSIIFDSAQLPHYNYVGDSIIGYRGHLGAGAIASNLRLDRSEVRIGGVASGLRKLGVLLGDEAEVGCGCVICPGTVIGRRSLIYPLSCVRGVIPQDSVLDSGEIRARGENI